MMRGVAPDDMKLAFDYQRERIVKRIVARSALPEDELEWRRYPAMRSRVKNAHRTRPAPTGEQGRSMCPKNGVPVAIGPIKCRRVLNIIARAGEPNHDSNHLPRPLDPPLAAATPPGATHSGVV